MFIATYETDEPETYFEGRYPFFNLTAHGIKVPYKYYVRITTQSETFGNDYEVISKEANGLMVARAEIGNRNDWERISDPVLMPFESIKSFHIY